jgi:hypothetical protein
MKKMEGEIKRGGKIYGLALAIALIFPLALLIPAGIGEPPPGYKYSQELYLPIDTGEIWAKSQPIDMEVWFWYPCHSSSIRVFMHNGEWHELESQVYGVPEPGMVTNCNVVFLIPQSADGSEKYYLVYDEKKMKAPNYTDHINLYEHHLSYSQLMGQFTVNIDFYMIEDDGRGMFAVVQKGDILGEPASQWVLEMKDHSTDPEPKNIEMISGFPSYYQITEEEYPGTGEVLVNKEILIDGNLMVKFRIVSQSRNGVIQSDNVYTYYHNPREDVNRIRVKSEVKALQQFEVGKGFVSPCYGIMYTFRVRSWLSELNFGDIMPFTHLYTKQESVREWRVPTNPSNPEYDYIIGNQGDFDMGTEAWFSADGGEKEKAHALIFSDNEGILKSGTDEDTDGLTAIYKVIQYLKVGSMLEVDIAVGEVHRNSFDGSNFDLIVPSDWRVEYEAEYCSVTDNSYKDIREESGMYQDLIQYL